LQDRKVLLYVGTLARWQGLHTLLEAAAILGHRSDFHLVVAASTGKGVARLKRRILSTGLSGRITILGGVDHRTMPSLYARAYLSTAPLARGARNELQGCCPLKIVESMACGTPVVAMNNSVMPEVGGDAARYAPVGSPRELAGEIHRVMVDRELRRTMSRQGIEWAARFTWEASARGTRSALQEAATGSPATDYTCPIPNPGTGARPASGTIPAPAPTSAPTISTAQHNKEDQIESTD